MGTAVLSTLLVIGIIALWNREVDALTCYQCDRTALDGHCNTTVTCHDTDACYLGIYQENGAEYLRHDCIDKVYCQTNPLAIVGRRALAVPQFTCKRCCYSDLCNREGCSAITTETTTLTGVTTTPTVVTPGASLCEDKASECAFPAFLSAVCTTESMASEYCPKSCNICKVAVDGNWAVWQDWGACSVSCGQGVRTRRRMCSNPAPLNGGRNCPGIGLETTSCSLTECPVDGEWSVWAPWVTCDVTCGGGTQTRIRTCSDPAPQHGGKPCANPLNFIDQRPCNVNSCPVDGHWSDWSGWTPCNVTCGGGVHSRVRTCTDPKPEHGGKQCSNLASFIEHEPCNPEPCAVDGKWSDWSAFSACNVTCGGGRKFRVRTCSNPSPIGTGKECENPTDNMESSECNTQWCPVDGHWSDWSSWLPCSVTCGGGTSSRTRSCTNPTPQHGGLACEHPHLKIEHIRCNNQQCDKDAVTVDGHWSAWSEWHACNVTCGGGNRFRVRTCSNPVPTNGGAPCARPETYHEYSPCNLQACPVTPISTARPHLLPVSGCNDSVFCSDSHIQPLACQDAYIATTYCPKLCRICGDAVSPVPCVDNVGSNCHDPTFLKFACADTDLALLCAKSCHICH